MNMYACSYIAIIIIILYQQETSEDLGIHCMQLLATCIHCIGMLKGVCFHPHKDKDIFLFMD